MSKFKVGDKVRVVSNTNDHKFDIGEIITITEVFGSTKDQEYAANGSSDWWCVLESELDWVNDYKNSNRYKLHKAASATGFSFSKLSRAMGRSDTYISNESKESRFNSRGDLTDKRYNQLIIDLAYAERTLNGNPAKVVDVSIDVEADEITECVEKRFEFVEKDAAPTFTPKQKIKSKTEVNKSIVWFILFALVVVILMLIAGIYKSIF